MGPSLARSVAWSVGPVRSGLPPPTLLPRPSPFTTHVSHPNNGRAKPKLTWGFPGHVISHRAQLVITLAISPGGNRVFSLVLSATLDYLHFSAQFLGFCPLIISPRFQSFSNSCLCLMMLFFTWAHVCACVSRSPK